MLCDQRRRARCVGLLVSPARACRLRWGYSVPLQIVCAPSYWLRGARGPYANARGPHCAAAALCVAPVGCGAPLSGALWLCCAFASRRPVGCAIPRLGRSKVFAMKAMLFNLRYTGLLTSWKDALYASSCAPSYFVRPDPPNPKRR